MNQQNKLLIIIEQELASLKDKSENANYIWEKEKYDNQIYILEKVLKQAE